MTPTRILETALYANDLGAAETFYTTVLGLPVVTREPGRHVFFRVGQGLLLLFRADATEDPPEDGLPIPPHGARGPGHACFAGDREEIARWVEHLTAHGVAIESDFHWPQGGRSIYFRDPAGNSLEIAEPRIWGFDD